MNKKRWLLSTKKTQSTNTQAPSAPVYPANFQPGVRIFIPEYTICRKAYTATSLLPVRAEARCEDISNVTIARMEAVISQHGGGRTNWGKCAMEVKKFATSQNTLTTNYDHITENAYTSGNTIEAVGFYYFYKSGTNSTINLQDLLHELENDTDLQRIYKIEDPTQSVARVVGHNSATYYGTTGPGSGGGSIDLRDNFIIGKDGTTLSTLTNQQQLQPTGDATVQYWYLPDVHTTTPFKGPNVGGRYEINRTARIAVEDIMNYPFFAVDGGYAKCNDETQTVSAYRFRCFILATPTYTTLTERKVFI